MIMTVGLIRTFNVTELLVGAVLMGLVTWRSGKWTSYDYWGKPQHVGVFQNLARYSFSGMMLVLAYVEYRAIVKHAPAEFSLALLAFVITLTLIGVTGWFRITTPRPLIRPTWKHLFPAGIRNFRRNRNGS